MPVSALRCTRAGLPAARAAAVIPLSVPRVPTQRSIPRPMASACAPCGSSIRHSTGTVIPASRSARASGTPTTASQSAPPARAAFAAGIMPCPYPSALTTAISPAVPAHSPSAAVFSLIAARSTTASPMMFTTLKSASPGGIGRAAPDRASKRRTFPNGSG